jgi:hypothetical protein
VIYTLAPEQHKDSSRNQPGRTDIPAAEAQVSTQAALSISSFTGSWKFGVADHPSGQVFGTLRCLGTFLPKKKTYSDVSAAGIEAPDGWMILHG